jgi:molecular chaperone Hsp33
MKDHLIRILTADGSLRATAAVTTFLVEETRRRQRTDPTATVALGRLATGTALMGSLLKGEQRLAPSVEGNGPLQKLHAETDAAGHLRASVRHPVAGLPPREGRFDVAGAVGRAGFLQWSRTRAQRAVPGSGPVYTSEIVEDLAYLTTSEQTPSWPGIPGPSTRRRKGGSRPGDARRRRLHPAAEQRVASSGFDPAA